MIDEDRLALLAHDLRGPLALIKGALVQVLRRTGVNGPLTDRQRAILDLSLRNVVVLEQLARDLMSCASGRTPAASATGPDAGAAPGASANAAGTTVAAVLGEGLTGVLTARGAGTHGGAGDGDGDGHGDGDGDLEGLRAGLAGLGIALEVEPGALRVPLGAGRLELVRILVNLVANALQHAPGPVTVQARRGARGIELTVKDRGPGLPPAALRALAGGAAAPAAPAAGPAAHRGGLASVRALVDRLGAEVRAGPADGEGGTAITVEVPLAPSSAAVPSPGGAP